MRADAENQVENERTARGMKKKGIKKKRKRETREREKERDWTRGRMR